MKVLVVSSKYQPEYSGSGLRAHNTYKRLKKKYGVNFEVVVNSFNTKLNKTYLYEGVCVRRISSPFPKNSRLKILNRLLVVINMLWEFIFSWLYIRKKIHEFDTLHTFGNSWSVGFFTWYFAKYNKGVVRELCNDMENPFYPIQFQGLIKKIFSSDKTLVVAISKKLAVLAESKGAKKVWSRPNPIGENFFLEPNKKLFYRRLHTPFSEKDVVISCISDFNARKNQIFALDVLSKLDDKFKLVMAGPLKDENVNYFESILDKIELLGLKDRVFIHSGFLGNFDEYLKLTDVFLFPSLSEGLGTPLLEAQACGVPVVSNKLEGISDNVLLDGQGGYNIKLNSSLWVDAISKSLALDSALLESNAKSILSQYSSDVIDEIYRRNLLDVS